MIWPITAKLVTARNGYKVQGARIPRINLKIGRSALTFTDFRAIALLPKSGGGASCSPQGTAYSTPHAPPTAQEFPAHRRQGRLLAPDRSGGGRGARAVAVGACRRSRRVASRGPRSADRLLGLDCARTGE